MQYFQIFVNSNQLFSIS